MLSPNVRVRENARIDQSVLLTNVCDRRGAPDRAGRSWTRTSSSPTAREVGVDHEADLARGYTVSEGGITMVGKGVIVTPT